MRISSFSDTEFSSSDSSISKCEYLKYKHIEKDLDNRIQNISHPKIKKTLKCTRLFYPCIVTLPALLCMSTTVFTAMIFITTIGVSLGSEVDEELYKFLIALPALFFLLLVCCCLGFVSLAVTYALIFLSIIKYGDPVKKLETEVVDHGLHRDLFSLLKEVNENISSERVPLEEIKPFIEFLTPYSQSKMDFIQAKAFYNGSLREFQKTIENSNINYKIKELWIDIIELQTNREFNLEDFLSYKLDKKSFIKVEGFLEETIRALPESAILNSKIQNTFLSIFQRKSRPIELPDDLPVYSILQNTREGKSFRRAVLDSFTSDLTVTLHKKKKETVNRQLLSVMAPYFSTLLNNGMEETTKSEITLPKLSSDEFKILFDFESNDLVITKKNLPVCLKLADMYLHDGLRKECEDYIKKKTRSFDDHYMYATLCPSSEKIYLDLKRYLSDLFFKKSPLLCKREFFLIKRLESKKLSEFYLKEIERYLDNWQSSILEETCDLRSVLLNISLYRRQLIEMELFEVFSPQLIEAFSKFLLKNPHLFESAWELTSPKKIRWIQNELLLPDHKLDVNSS